MKFIVLISKKSYGYMAIEAENGTKACEIAEERINNLSSTQPEEWAVHFAMGELQDENIPSSSKH